MYKITPALGWNTWNTFTTDINEELVLRSADFMANSPLRAAGYEYIVVDDCWSLKKRDENGCLVADPEKFPHGMKYVADYIHKLGLKFGMYSDSGFLTCGGYPGSYNYEFIDAKTFASWDVDYLKYDYCNRSRFVPGPILYRRMGLALANCGRDILFSACTAGHDDTYLWIKETGAHSWRSTDDILDHWDAIHRIILQQMDKLSFNGQGCFNDLDMLICGMNGKGNCSKGGCTPEEYYTHFAFWCFFGSTLMLGSDIRSMDDETMKLVTNPGLLRIDQDRKYSQPFIMNTNRSAEIPVMAKYLDDGKIAIGAFNLSDGTAVPYHTYVSTEDVGMPLDAKGRTLKLTDVRTGEVLFPANGVIRFPDLPAHSSRVYIAEVVRL